MSGGMATSLKSSNGFWVKYACGSFFGGLQAFSLFGYSRMCPCLFCAILAWFFRVSAAAAGLIWLVGRFLGASCRFDMLVPGVGVPVVFLRSAWFFRAVALHCAGKPFRMCPRAGSPPETCAPLREAGAQKVQPNAPVLPPSVSGVPSGGRGRSAVPFARLPHPARLSGFMRR